ncbi:MAG: hypothetical protein ACIALR_14845 [Blastopirellula sp. JB062]
MPVEHDIPISLLSNLYRNTGSHATPVWVRVKGVKDLSVPFSKERAESMDIDYDWKFERGTHKSSGLTFQVEARKSLKDDLDVFRDSFLSGTPIEIYAADGLVAEAGTEGLRAYVECFDFPINKPLNGVSVIDITLGLTRVVESSAVVLPSWYVIPEA